MNHKFNIVGIIQVRMNSKRLPGKAMMKLNGIPIVEFIYKRINKSKKLNKIVFATTDNKFDDKLYNFLLKLGANVFRGSEFDLLDR